MHTAAVWDEKDSLLLSAVKQVKLQSGKSFPKLARTCEISGLMFHFSQAELSVRQELTENDSRGTCPKWRKLNHDVCKKSLGLVALHSGELRILCCQNCAWHCWILSWRANLAMGKAWCTLALVHLVSPARTSSGTGQTEVAPWFSRATLCLLSDY